EWYYLWNLCDPHVVSLPRHDARVTAVTYSPDGHILASADERGTIRLADPNRREGLRELRGHTGVVTQIAFLLGGRSLVSGSRDRSVRLWETATGRCLRVLSFDRPVLSIDPSPDGHQVAVMFDVEDRVTVYDLASGASRFVLGPTGGRNVIPSYIAN